MSNKKKSIITLVGLRQARKGFSFLHEGSLNECERCELFNICMKSLEKGRIYKVTTVRDKTFPCQIHEEGVRVVEVIEPEIEVALESRIVFPSAIISYQPQECERLSCPNYRRCVPQGLMNGDKCIILEIKGKIKCPFGRSFVLVPTLRVTE